MMGGLRAGRSSFEATRQGTKGTLLKIYLAKSVSFTPVEISTLIRMVVNEES
jgi:hypothetical protein